MTMLTLRSGPANVRAPNENEKKFELAPGLETDSGAYEVLFNAVRDCVAPGAFVEIGTRRGGSTQIIIEALLASHKTGRTVICLDPYGNIEYAEREGTIRRLDYTNSMRSDTQRNLYNYVHGKQVDLHLLILEDTEYFEKFAKGYPVYNESKVLINEYAFIFYDGPHDVASIKKEIDFFQSRTPVGAYCVFDDIRGYYPHDEEIEPYVLARGWELVEKIVPKASYRRVSVA